MQTGEYHFVTDSKNALFTDDNLGPKCTDQVPATRISKPLDQNQRLMEVPICTAMRGIMQATQKKGRSFDQPFF